MKRFFLSLFFAAGVLTAAAAAPDPDGGIVALPPESISIAAGEVRKIEMPFPVTQYKSSTENVRLANASGRSFEMEGVTTGNAVVTVSMPGMNKVFRVTVSNSVMPVYRELCRELSDLPEVGVELSDNVLALRGEITKPGHWEYFRRVMRRYENDCRNYVTFRAGPALYAQLTKEFENAGYKVADSVSPEQPGQLRLQTANGVLTVSGYLLCKEDVSSVKRILAAQKWLQPGWNGNSLKVETDLNIADTQLDVGVVFVGVTRTQLEYLGNSSADGTVLSWNLIAWFRALSGAFPEDISGNSGAGVYSNFNTNLKGTLVFLGNNGISDFRDAGHLTLTSNSAEAASYENGGTLNIKVVNKDVAEIKEIDYGLKLKVRGGLVRADQVRLELELEKSLAPVKQNDDYLQRKTKAKSVILCPLNKTAVIAGQKESAYSKNRSGYAFLRHIPVVNWFMANDEELGEEFQILILVCPQIANGKTEMTTKPSEQTEDLERSVSKSVRAKDKKVHEREERNWFLKMFTW